jgi:acid phosphatase (class A)
MKLFAISARLVRPAVLLAVLAASVLLSFAKDGALNYLPPGAPDSAAILAPPPVAGSAEQAADMAEVVAVHRACTTNEAATAFSEKKFSVFNFTPAVGGFFQAGKFPKAEAFFEHVQSDAAIATDAAKEYWKRPRPYVVDPSLASGKLEKSFGYPSGHSTESMVLALVLAEVFPNDSEGIYAIARDIGWHRVRIARHYPTDIYAGRVFARAIVREMKASAQFQKDLAEVKREIAAASQPASPAELKTTAEK